MNIVHLITSIDKGGAENHLSCLIRGQVKKNKVLVTGAAGFLGSHLAEKLANNGDTVVGVDNMSDYYDKDLKKALKCYKKAADKNFLPACLNLSIMYFEGQGTKKDLNIGYNYLSIAYNSSYQPAIGIFEKYKKQFLIV